MRFASITGGVVTNVVLVDDTDIFLDAQWMANNPADEWVETTAQPEVGIGWAYDGSVFIEPPEPPHVPKYYVMVTGPEWVSLFTDAEWDWIDVQRETTPRTNAIKELRRLMDAIRWTDSVNVASPNMDPFYNWLLNNNIPGGQTRIDELRLGILR
jgi:hypothetical protein